MLNFQLVHSRRTSDWNLTLGTIVDFFSWYFGLDRNTYMRMTMASHGHDNASRKAPWSPLSVHGKPTCCTEDFTKFSLMGLDQSQEHSVQHIKSDGGSRGVYYNQEEKERLEISRPDILWLINEFKYAIREYTDAEENEYSESFVHVPHNVIKHLSFMVKAVDDGLVSYRYLDSWRWSKGFCVHHNQISIWSWILPQYKTDQIKRGCSDWEWW